jgi:phospholipid-binding lipoprotein MlaA
VNTRRVAVAAALAATLLATGCATTGSSLSSGATPPTAHTPGDPFEAFNRKVFAFNDALDRAVLEPVARAYRDNVPELVRTGVSNVLGNIGDLWSAANQFLQGKGQLGFEMTMRVMTNTFFGLGGLLDPATPLGLTRRSEDFGQTLGKWGLGPGPYIVLPLLGPSSTRDAAGRALDTQVSPSALASRDAARAALTGIQILDTRASLLGTTALVDKVALDRYSFIRDAYLQRRLDAVYDGAPPLEDPFADEEAKDNKSAPSAPPKAGAKP